MPKETIYRATDPAGGHHYRGSISRTYTHAILLCLDGKWTARGFAGRPDLAEKAAASERATCANYANGTYGMSTGTDAEKAWRRAVYAAAKVIAAPCIIVDKRGA